MGRRIIFLFFIFLLFQPCFADEPIVGFEEEDLPVLNEELRKIKDDIISENFWEEDGGDIELKTADDVDMQQKEIKQMRIENRTADPSSPATGEIWFRTDL